MLIDHGYGVACLPACTSVWAFQMILKSVHNLLARLPVAYSQFGI